VGEVLKDPDGGSWMRGRVQSTDRPEHPDRPDRPDRRGAAA
jgi:hypothetical protein